MIENGVPWTTYLRVQSSIVTNLITRSQRWIYDEKTFSGNHEMCKTKVIIILKS